GRGRKKRLLPKSPGDPAVGGDRNEREERERDREPLPRRAPEQIEGDHRRHPEQPRLRERRRQERRRERRQPIAGADEPGREEPRPGGGEPRAGREERERGAYGDRPPRPRSRSPESIER